MDVLFSPQEAFYLSGERESWNCSARRTEEVNGLHVIKEGKQGQRGLKTRPRPCSQMVARPVPESTSSSIRQPYKNIQNVTESHWRIPSWCQLHMIGVRKWKSPGLLGIFMMYNGDCCLILNCCGDCYSHGCPSFELQKPTNLINYQDLTVCPCFPQ